MLEVYSFGILKLLIKIGMNPVGLKNAIEEAIRKSNLKIKVAAIFGDDVTVC